MSDNSGFSVFGTSAKYQAGNASGKCLLISTLICPKCIDDVYSEKNRHWSFETGTQDG